MNLDTKLVVANLGQDFALCCDIFGFPTLLFFDPPCLYLEVRLFAVQIIRSIYYALTLHYHEEDSQPSFRRSSTTDSDASLGAYTSYCPISDPIPGAPGSAPYTPWSVFISLRIENRSTQGPWKGSPFGALPMLLHHHRPKSRSLCFARFVSRLWVCSVCNKQGFLNPEMDVTQIERGISVERTPVSQTQRRTPGNSVGILQVRQRVPRAGVMYTKPFFYGFAGGWRP